MRGYQADYVIADKAYDARTFIETIETSGALPVIPARSNRSETRYYDPHLYKERHLVECFFNKIKRFRRIFSRFDKLRQSYAGFLAFVSTLIWLR